jgi:parallel beta-helix repeat protein
MQRKQKNKKVVMSVFAFAGLLVFSLLAIGGSLEPSAPPGATMKTLDEVEPRVPIHASDLPLTIAEPNSYYLAENINFADPLSDAITIECNDVTIDLMGYTLKGPDATTKDGIYMNRCSNVEIRNGTVRDFYYGIHERYTTAKQHRVINVRAMSNENTGIYLEGYGHLVKNCTAAENGHRGIHTGSGCTVTDNTVYLNVGSGIRTLHGCTVTGNTARLNNYCGIHTDSGCTVTGNTAHYNQAIGIYAEGYSTVAGNTAYQNNQANSTAYAGIRVNYGCLVKGNTVAYNKQNNIYLIGHDNAIEENLVINSTGYGIYFKIAGNFYANNRASGNGTDYGNGHLQTDGGGNWSF